MVKEVVTSESVLGQLFHELFTFGTFLVIDLALKVGYENLKLETFNW